MQLVYTGRRLTSDNKLVYEYEEDSGQNRLYAKPLRMGTPVGTTLDVTETADGISMSGSSAPRVVAAHEVTKYRPDATVANWQAADVSASTMYADMRAQKRLATETARDPLHDALNVVRDAYRSQRGIGSRIAFVRYVDEYIHS